MKRYGYLFEQITDFANLYQATQKAFCSHRDKPTIKIFWFNLEYELFKLQEELSTQTYKPRSYQTFLIYEPKQRQICAAPIRDRVVHHAICNIISPIWEKGMIYDSYACRIGKGTQAAIFQSKKFAHKYKFYLQFDVKHFFATLDRQVLKYIICRKIKDKKVLELLDLIIDQDLIGSEEGKGVPIGNLTSQWFANLYLNQLDQFIKNELQVKGYLRYMDDFILFENSKEKLHNLSYEINSFVEDKLKLQLKPNPITSPCHQGISFLGFCVFPNLIILQNKKLKTLKEKIIELEEKANLGEITEAELANRVQSMIAHISKYNTFKTRQKIFEEYGKIK
jgi:retron-type reverse transcriptase